MKRIIRISVFTLIAVTAFAGNSISKAPAIASNTYSSVPGGGGPMPTCNPFGNPCTPIR